MKETKRVKQLSYNSLNDAAIVCHSAIHLFWRFSFQRVFTWIEYWCVVLRLVDIRTCALMYDFERVFQCSSIITCNKNRFCFITERYHYNAFRSIVLLQLKYSNIIGFIYFLWGCRIYLWLHSVVINIVFYKYVNKTWMAN